MRILQHFASPAILILVGALISAGGAVLAAYQQSLSEKQLRQKSEEIAELNKRIAQSITGGDSFAYITPTFLMGSSKSALLTLVHQGEYPLYDLNIRIVDLDKFEKVKQRYSLQDMQKDEMHFSVSNLAPNEASFLSRVHIQSNTMRWNIFFSARNGFFTELLRVCKVGSEWKVALKVMNTPTSGEAKTLIQQVDKGFPLNPAGQVTW